MRKSIIVDRYVNTPDCNIGEKKSPIPKIPFPTNIKTMKQSSSVNPSPTSLALDPPIQKPPPPDPRFGGGGHWDGSEVEREARRLTGK